MDIIINILMKNFVYKNNNNKYYLLKIKYPDPIPELIEDIEHTQNKQSKTRKFTTKLAIFDAFSLLFAG